MKKTLLTWLLILTSITTFAADKPISGLTVFNGVPGTNDLIPFVNRADVSQSTNGSTRSMTWSNLNYSLRTSYPAMTLTNIGSSGGYVNVTNIIGYNGSTFYGSGAVVDNWVFYGNNTFTGDTNRFASTVLLTNMNNTISGDGAGLTNLSLATNSIIGTNVVNDVINFGSRWRCLYMAPSNYFTGTAGVAETNFFTNIAIPPLMSSNSIVVCGVMGSKTNLTSQPLWFAEFRDTTTNGSVISGVSLGGAAAVGGAYVPQPTTFLFANCNSFTYQWVQGTNYQVSSVGYNLGWNTQNTNTLAVSVWHSATANCAPLTLHRFGIWEIY